MNRAVFLDRDGVINRVVLRNGRPAPPASVEEVEFLPGVAGALDELRRADFRIIVVTNQPDVGKGTQRREVVEAIHDRLRRAFSAIDDIYVCYHVDQDGCVCRKPKPGLLLEAARTWALDLPRSVMVGDRWRDIGAGKAAGCKTILVITEPGQTPTIDIRFMGSDPRQAEQPDAVVQSLAEAAALILSALNTEQGQTPQGRQFNERGQTLTGRAGSTSNAG